MYKGSCDHASDGRAAAGVEPKWAWTPNVEMRRESHPPLRLKHSLNVGGLGREVMTFSKEVREVLESAGQSTSCPKYLLKRRRHHLSNFSAMYRSSNRSSGQSFGDRWQFCIFWGVLFAGGPVGRTVSPSASELDLVTLFLDKWCFALGGAVGRCEIMLQGLGSGTR